MNVSPYAFPGIPELSSCKAEPQNVIDYVCEKFSVTHEAMKSKCRWREVMHPRQLCRYLLHEMFPELSLRRIGELTGGKDHTTVIHSLQTVKNLADSDPAYRSELDRLKSSIIRYMRSKTKEV